MQKVKNDQIFFKKITIMDLKLTVENIEAAVRLQNEIGIKVFVKAQRYLLGEIHNDTAPTPLQMRFCACQPSATNPDEYKINGWIRFMLAPYKGCKNTYHWYQFFGFCRQSTGNEGIRGNIMVAYKKEQADVYF